MIYNRSVAKQPEIAGKMSYFLTLWEVENYSLLYKTQKEYKLYLYLCAVIYFDK